MSAMSNHLETQVIRYFFRTAAMTGSRPTTWTMSLHTGSPGEDGTSNECSGGSYARADVLAGNAGNSAFSADTDGVSTNVYTITFPTPTVSWGTVTHFAIWDTAGPYCLCYGALTSPSSIVAGIGVVISFAAGAITITAA